MNQGLNSTLYYLDIIIKVDPNSGIFSLNRYGSFSIDILNQYIVPLSNIFLLFVYLELAQLSKSQSLKVNLVSYTLIVVTKIIDETKTVIRL